MSASDEPHDLRYWTDRIVLASTPGIRPILAAVLAEVARQDAEGTPIIERFLREEGAPVFNAAVCIREAMRLRTEGT